MTLDGPSEAKVAEFLPVAGGPQVAVAALQRILLAEPGVPGTTGSLIAQGRTVTFRPGVIRDSYWPDVSDQSYQGN